MRSWNAIGYRICGTLTLIGVACACVSEPATGPNVLAGSSAGDTLDIPDLTSHGRDDGGVLGGPDEVSAFRLHFATPFVAPDDDPNGFMLCPTGDDCFHSVTVYSDGQIALDDHLGRTYGEVTATEKEAFEQLVLHDQSFKAGLTQGFGCPGVPSGYSVWIVATVRLGDGTEQVLNDVEGCIAGELTNQPQHALTRLRKLLDEELRLRYADCAKDAQRPICRDRTQSIIQW